MNESSIRTEKKRQNWLVEGLSVASILIVFVCQLLFLNPYVSSWDQVDFSLAVKRYDLMAMQPHFPGYPFFILGGKVVHLLVASPSQALTAFNILFYASSLFPIYKITRSFLGRSFAMFATAIIYSTSYCIITVNQPMSEGAALSALWWYLWGILIALRSNKTRDILLPLALLSLLLGIRLSYMPFSVGILFVFYWKVKNDDRSIREIIHFSIYAVIFQLIWIIALIVSEGGLIGFIKLSLAFTSGHFNDWGGAVDTSEFNIFHRLFMLFKNIFWTGIAGESLITAAIYILLLIFILYSVFQKKQYDSFLTVLYVMFVSYFGWALLAQNIEKARHVLPLVIVLILLLCIRLFAKKVPILTLLISLVLLGQQVYKDVVLLRAEVTDRPAIYKMNEYIEKNDKPVILYTWEETRVLQYLQVPYKHKRIETFQLFQYDSKYYRGRTVLLTDKVVQGFISQGIPMDGRVKKVANFQSNQLFDPVYHEITVYEWLDK